MAKIYDHNSRHQSNNILISSQILSKFLLLGCCTEVCDCAVVCLHVHVIVPCAGEKSWDPGNEIQNRKVNLKGQTLVWNKSVIYPLTCACCFEFPLVLMLLSLRFECGQMVNKCCSRCISCHIGRIAAVCPSIHPSIDPCFVWLSFGWAGHHKCDHRLCRSFFQILVEDLGFFFLVVFNVVWM